MGLVQTISSLTRRIFNLGEPKYANPSGAYGGFGLRTVGEVDAMGNTSTLYSIMRQLSTSTAMVDWHLYRISADGRRVYGPAEDNRVEVTRHQALAVLDKPNSLMTRMELFERTQLALDGPGEAFLLVEKTDVGSIPTALWPIRPDRMVEVITNEGLIGWVYRAPDGTQIPWRLDEIIHIQMPNPSNMYRGLGPVQTLRVDLEAQDAAAQYNRNYFLNSAQPGGVIQVDNSLDDRSFNRIVEQWGERHRGVRNAHRVGVLENGAKWAATAYSMRDMQFVDLRNMSREMIREAYAIHPHMLGLSETVNLANAKAADATYAERLIVPRLERIKQALNNVFLPMFGTTGQGVEFCYDNPVPEDRESENQERDSKVKNAVLLIDAGGDPVQVLEAMGLPPIDFAPRETAPTVAPISPAPAPQPTEGEDPNALSESQAADVAALLKEVFG